MKRAGLFLTGAALALTSSLAVAGGPTDLLPDIYRNPAPSPSPTPAPRPSPTATASRPATPTPNSTSVPVIQEIPGGSGSGSSGSSGSRGTPAPSAGRVTLPPGFPSLSELERMDSDEVNAILGLRPKFDIPAAARRSVDQVGLIAEGEGGFAASSLANQPAALVRAALAAADGPVVSRWGHILMRRVLASRLDAPAGMNPVEFVGLRAKALSGMGESAVTRALVQDVDGSNYDKAMADAAMAAYAGTGDILGMCPVARLSPDLREDGEWELVQGICLAYLGEARSAERRLQRVLSRGQADEIDVRLAQRYAGAAGEGRRAVNIEWDGVQELTPLRFGLARALGADLPDNLLDGGNFAASEVLIPAAPLLSRVQASDAAGARGILSSSAMVDLYSMLWASDRYERADKATAGLLRNAYVAASVPDRIAAMRELWSSDDDYGRKVLTAYAAARVPVSDELAADAAPLIEAMLAAGLDRSALRWGEVVSEGSEGWAMLALAQPNRENGVSEGAVRDFRDIDESANDRRTAFLVAGLAGLGRLDEDALADFGDDLGVNYTRASAWSGKIDRAAAVNNPALVALLAGLGMQGSDWSRMTPRQLYWIVRSLNRVGLSAEARMIAAEAVARG